VSSDGVQPLSPLRAASAGTTTGPDARAGLWIGTALIDHVSQPANVSAPEQPLPVGAPLQFRLLLHVDNSGQVKLLQKVLEMFRNGTLKTDPNDSTKKVVDTPGRFVLVTDDSLIPNFTGSELRDGQQVARRLSSAAFGFKQPLACTGTGAFGSGKVSCQVTLSYDDPVNPFKHRYHPDHDNLDERFQTQLSEGIESFTVVRQIEFEFTTQDPENLSFAGWGDNQLGGNYLETITGLHHEPIYIAGTFRLTRASTIGVLNDGIQ
jgi:hypothetical protein